MMKRILILTIALVVSSVGVMAEGASMPVAEKQAKSAPAKSADKKAADKKTADKKAADKNKAAAKPADKKGKDAKEKKPAGPNIVKEIRDTVNTIVIDQALADFIILPPVVEEKKASGPVNKGPATPNRNGFRVQVYMGNSASERTARTRAVSSMYPAYMAGSAPYFKVQCGNFKTRAEADAAAARIRSRFPAFASEVRVVPARINP